MAQVAAILASWMAECFRSIIRSVNPRVFVVDETMLRRSAAVAGLCGLRYETIRPGHYGPMTNPSHVHYVVNTPGYRPRMFDLRFEDDPVIVARRKDGVPDDDGFAPGWMVVSPVTRDANGVWHVTRDLPMVRE